MPHAPARGPRRCLLALAAVLLAPIAGAAQLFVDASAAPGGDGSMALPLSDLAGAAARVQSGDTIHLRGEFRAQKLTLSGLSDVTITRWPGEGPRPLVRGDIPLASEGWTFDAQAGAWSIQLPQAPLRVLWNWETNIDEHGRHFGFLRRGPATGPLTPGQWRFELDGRLLLVPPPGAAGPDPNAGADSYSCILRGNAVRVVGGERIAVREVDFALWAYADETDAGYAVRMESVTESIVEDCSFRDCGKHAAGFVAEASSNNTFRRIVSAGLDHGALPSAGHLVFFSFGADVESCLAEDCDLLCYTSLDWSGAPMGGSCNGVFTHAAGGAVVRGVVFKRIRCVEFAGSLESAFGLGEHTTLPANRASMDPADYPVRFIECELTNAARMFFAGGSGPQAAAFERCRLDFSRAGEQGQPWVFRVQGTDARVLFVSCVISADGSGVIGSEARLFDIPPESSLLLDGCVVHVSGPLGQNCAHVRQSIFADPPGYPNSMVVARQTVFSRETPGCLHKGNNIMSVQNLPASLVVRDCWYWNIQPGAYSLGNLAVRNQGPWTSTIDPAGVYAVDPGFVDAPGGVFEGAPGGALRLSTRWLANAAKLGLNRLPYSGHFGAYQHGPAADLNDDGQVGSADLANLLASWGVCTTGPDPCEEDISADGMVNSVDLAILLGQWSSEPSGGASRLR